MRLTLPGKLVLFALGLAGLYALWRHAPSREVVWRVPSQRVVIPPESPESAPEEARLAVGTPIGYVGIPPLVDLREAGVGDASLVERPSVAALLKDVGSGGLKAAVVDFPSVVFAARRGSLPYHVVLLVRWRKGADVLTVRGGGPWTPSGGLFFEVGTSGELLARRVLASGQYSPAEVVAGRKALSAARGPEVGAAAGRRETLPAQARGWPVWRSAEDFGLLMPDVLVVNTRWARENGESVEELVRAWLSTQEALRSNPKAFSRLARQSAPGLETRAAVESLEPAPVNDQMAFAGLSETGITYMELVMRQMRIIEVGPRPPDREFNVPMDPAPLSQAAPLLLK